MYSFFKDFVNNRLAVSIKDEFELGLYEGFQTIADLGFLISEMKQNTFIFYKI
jgi:hypothetical protein